jgi:diadenosine tetraphosphatase ApaH/serine/threonine PP2A family protein phosphatase
MRYAIISDIHANRQALKAVLTDARGIGVDRIIALGDLVGYGPCPAAALETVHGTVHNFVLGNHDAVCSGQLSAEYFNDAARQVIEWTRGVVDRKAAAFFQALPLVLAGDGCRFTHGNFTDPGRFGYIFDAEEALANFQATSEQLLFAGHSHLPGLFVVGESGRPHWLAPQDFMVEEGKRYIVNVGSVGQPRDRDIRASYCIFEPRKGVVRFRKVPFDLDAYREDVKRAGIAATASYFLALEAGQPARPLREIVDFRPVSAADSVKTEIGRAHV